MPSAIVPIAVVRRILGRLKTATDWQALQLAKVHRLLAKYPQRRTAAIQLVAMATTFVRSGHRQEARILVDLAASAIGGMRALATALGEQDKNRAEAEGLMRTLQDSRPAATAGLRGARDTGRIRGFSLRRRK